MIKSQFEWQNQQLEYDVFSRRIQMLRASFTYQSSGPYRVVRYHICLLFYILSSEIQIENVFLERLSKLSITPLTCTDVRRFRRIENSGEDAIWENENLFSRRHLPLTYFFIRFWILVLTFLKVLKSIRNFISKDISKKSSACNRAWSVSPTI